MLGVPATAATERLALPLVVPARLRIPVPAPAKPTVNVEPEKTNCVLVALACVPAVPSTTPPVASEAAEVTHVAQAMVPELVIGPPVMGAVVAMLVTVPAEAAAQLAVVPFEVKTCVLVPIGRRATEFAPLPKSRSPVTQPVGMARVSVPLDVTGELVTTKPVGAAKPTLVTVPALAA